MALGRCNTKLAFLVFLKINKEYRKIIFYFHFVRIELIKFFHYSELFLIFNSVKMYFICNKASLP